MFSKSYKTVRWDLGDIFGGELNVIYVLKQQIDWLFQNNDYWSMVNKLKCCSVTFKKENCHTMWVILEQVPVFLVHWLKVMLLLINLLN